MDKKIFQDGKAGAAAFFRMELAAEYVALLDRCVDAACQYSVDGGDDHRIMAAFK